MAILRYAFTMDDHIPASQITAFTRGAVVNGAQSGVNTVTVHEGHDYQVSDKFLYALTRTNILTSRIFAITAKAATTITFSGSPETFTDKNYLVPLGADTGGVLQADGTYSILKWDGSTVVCYKDPHGDATLALATIPVEPGGEVGFWANTTEIWCVARNTGGGPLRAYILSSVSAAIVSGGVAADPLWDAKGDIAVGLGPDAADNLAVGSNGQVLTADSAQTLGVKWATPVTAASTNFLVVQVFS